jgi:hypothetical protein
VRTTQCGEAAPRRRRRLRRAAAALATQAPSRQRLRRAARTREAYRARGRAQGAEGGAAVWCHVTSSPSKKASAWQAQHKRTASERTPLLTSARVARAAPCAMSRLTLGVRTLRAASSRVLCSAARADCC